MEYLRGFEVKPYTVTETGVVLFTDGTDNNISPNQFICEAYGYRYDNQTGASMAFDTPNTLISNLPFNTNTVRGSNTLSVNASNTFIAGDNNIVGNNRNVMLVGEAHELEPAFNNSTVVGGQRALITREGETALGGGKETLSDSTDTAEFSSRRQTSTIELAGVTIDNTATNLTVQGMSSDEVADNYINVKANSIVGVDIYITRLQLGGTTSDAGDYSYRKIRGAVRIDRSGTMNFIIGLTTNIAKYSTASGAGTGVNGTCIMAETTVGDQLSFSVNVQDRNNVHNLWSASVTLHEVISATSF